MKTRVIFLQTKRAPMRVEEMRAALGGLDEEAPALAAFRQLLDEELGAALLDASSPALNPALGTHAGGARRGAGHREGKAGGVEEGGGDGVLKGRKRKEERGRIKIKRKRKE